MGDSWQREVLLHLPRPEAMPGQARVRALHLKDAVTRLVPFITRTNTPTLGHVWIYAQDGLLVALATDLEATGQMDTRVVDGGELPLLGLAPAEAKTLAKAISKITGHVTLRTAGAQLAVDDGPDEIAAVDVRVPTPIDLGVLDSVGKHLLDTCAACQDSALPLGTVKVSPRKERLFGPTSARRWFTATGRVYVEVDEHYRGYYFAERPLPPTARRPLPTGRVQPATPTPTQREEAA